MKKRSNSLVFVIQLAIHKNYMLKMGTVRKRTYNIVTFTSNGLIFSMNVLCRKQTISWKVLSFDYLFRVRVAAAPLEWLIYLCVDRHFSSESALHLNVQYSR